ncbi:MAG: fatty acid desaturase [Deltaproteobacteria bacterium]|nr:fatty acid desaturase [Deltaproteobacteria bacterium]
MSAARTLDLSTIDAEGFLAELSELRRELEASFGEEDLAHLRTIERIGRVATAVGLATAWLPPNPVSILGLSLGRSTRWLLMHHCGHRGYDRVPGVPERFTSRAFARGRRRFLDWPDWMLPEAWIYEHNVLHHTHTGEETDPDLIERNTEELRRLPLAARYAVMGLLMLTWRTSYYAPKTLAALYDRDLRLERKRSGDEAATTPSEAARLLNLWRTCYLPAAGYHFVLLPLLFAPLGPLAVGSAFLNSVAADLLTNAHTFLVVGPNHTGDDIPRFDARPATKAERMVRQVAGSVNYATGTEVVDYLQLWLNYQIEHHVFPDVPMLAYRRVQPRVKALCEKYGVPYVQESVWTRFRKMLDVAVGKASMPRGETARGRAPRLDGEPLTEALEAT